MVYGENERKNGNYHSILGYTMVLRRNNGKEDGNYHVVGEPRFSKKNSNAFRVVMQVGARVEICKDV